MNLLFIKSPIFSAVYLASVMIACAESRFASETGKVNKPSSSPSEQIQSQDPDDATTANETKPKKSKQGSANSEADSDRGVPNAADINSLPDGRVQERFQGESASSSRPVDIIFAVDTSGSMDDEKASLESNMARFIGKFTADAANLDYQIFMIGEDFRFPSASNRIRQIPLEVDSNNALAVLDDVLQNGSAHGIRSDSLKQIVVVTDDNAEDVTSSEFKDFLQTTPSTNGKTKINGFVGLPTSRETASCELASVGHEYIKLGQDPELGGLIQDLCIQDWSQLLQNLAANIIVQASRRQIFALNAAADISKAIEVQVDGQNVSSDAFSYDPIGQAIIFNAQQAPKNEATVIVTYTAEP